MDDDERDQVGEVPEHAVAGAFEPQIGDVLGACVLQRFDQRIALGDVDRRVRRAVAAVKSRATRAPDRELAARFQRRCLELGLVLHAVRAETQSTVRIAPPLTVSIEELESGIHILDQAMAQCMA